MMWMFFCFMLSIILFVIIPTVTSNFHQPSSNVESYLVNKRIRPSLNNNVLWNTEPPTVVSELPMSITFYANEVLRLHCNITGNPRPSYKWYMSTNDVSERLLTIHDRTFDKTPVSNDYTLVIDGKWTKKTYFKYIYYCSAQNPLGILYSNKIIVEKVTRPSLISIKYILNSVYEGEKFVAQCHLVPDFFPIYKFKRWEVRIKSGKILYLNKTAGRFSVINSTKFPQLHIRNVTNEDFSAIKVRCIFQSTVDNRIDVGDRVFRPIEKFVYDDLPYLTKLSCTGETVTATVGTNIELPWCSVPITLNVSWYKLDNADSKKKIKIENKVNDSKYAMISKRYGNLLILNVTKEDAGIYLVEGIERPLKTVFTLKVYETIAIYLSPKTIRKKLSESAEFLCSATFSRIQFSWLHNGIKVVSGYDDGNVEVFDTYNTSTLKIKKVRLSVSGVYQCIATSLDEGMGFTDYRQISGIVLLPEIPPTLIKQSPRVEKDSSAAHVQMSKRNSFQTIECIFAANSRPNIDWYHNSNKVPITDTVTMSIQEDQNSIYNIIAKITINLKKIEIDGEISKYAGEYEAKATNSLGSTSCYTFILMEGNFEIRLPMDQTAVGGVDYSMTCYFISMEVPEFLWERKIDKSEIWETLPVNHRTNLIERGHRLLIKNVIKAEDEGIYRCTIKYNKDKIAATTRLLVAYPPILQNLPSKHDSSQKQTHICTTRSAADKPWYAWWTFTKYNNNETIIISPDMKDSMFTVYYNQPSMYNGQLLPGVPRFLYNYPNTGVDLIVKARSNDKDAFGKFLCHARNHIGSDEKTIEDNFLRLEFKIAPPSSSEVIIGDDLYLDCTAKESDLDPFVKWRLSKESIFNTDTIYIDINDLKNEYNGRIFQYKNGTLVMRNVKETDPSKLICFIFPTGKSDKVQSKISYIEIRVPARIKELEKEIYREAGSSFNLSCDVYGHTQNMKVKWYYRSSTINIWGSVHETCIFSNENQCQNQYQFNSGQFTPINEFHNRTYHTVHLEFQDASESISGHYKCEASNKYNIEADQTITAITIISKPSIVIVDSLQKETTSTSISFDWKPPEKDGNRPIFRYIIKYFEMPFLKNNEEHKNLTQKILRVNSTVQSIVIDQLRPYKKYGVTVSAENAVGVSEPASIFLMTQEAKPQKSVNNLIASSTKPHEILVSWMDPDPEYQNGQIIRYQMCYQISPAATDSKNGLILDSLNWPDNYADVNKYPEVKCNDTEEKMITVSYLPQFTDFIIRVIAFNSKGASPALFTKVRTLEDLPQAAPNMVTCEGQHQGILLNWNPPGLQTINGVLIGYAVYYYQPNKYSDESGMKSIIVHGRTNVVIDDLKPYTSYSIQVMAVNRKGLGPPSASVRCATKEAKPEAPELVKAVRINNTCIHISWLHTLNPNGIIKEYCVVGLGFDVKNPKCQPPDMNKRYNTIVLCDLYERFSDINVFARNQYDGAFRKAPRIDDINYIISIGGEINVKEGSSVILPCETTSESNKNLFWKKDGQVINNEFSNLKIFPNFSLEIISIEKHGTHSYICATEIDNIEYQLIVQESTDGIPKTPIIDDYRVTENSIFIRWKSQGTSDVAVPITGFNIVWQNLYTNESKNVMLDEKSRSFYLNNVTCASDFIIKVCSQSGNGKSKFSESKRLRTLGSVPQIAHSSDLLPLKNIDAKSANFNLLAFAPGDNCSTMYFTIELSLTSMGNNDFTDLIFNKNISIYQLENKCCYKVTGLNPMTEYKYRITAYNPAGSTTNFNTMETLEINGALPGSRKLRNKKNNNAIDLWLLMIIMMFVIISVLIIVIVGILYIIRSKEKKSQPINTKIVTKKPEHNQYRIERTVNHDDTASIDSEPSPYAVYQPNVDQNNGQMWTQQVSQQSSTPLYNYNDHHYNQIRYDKIPGRLPMASENNHDIYRRANSAECLSSLGNASMTGIAELESPSNIDPNYSQDYFRAPFNRCDNNDEIFQNIRYPDFSTINRRKIKRDSEIQSRLNEEQSRFMSNGVNPGTVNSNRYYDSSRVLQQQMYHVPANHPQRLNYHQQVSVPEPVSTYQKQYGHPNSRTKNISGSGLNYPSNQTVLYNNPLNSAQTSAYGGYYGQRRNDIQPYSTSSGIRRDNPQQNIYSSYITGSSLSNYNPPHRPVIARSGLQPVESPDEGIYTDRVVVV